jgi:aldehyde dehydrogenase (NAD+)
VNDVQDAAGAHSRETSVPVIGPDWPGGSGRAEAGRTPARLMHWIGGEARSRDDADSMRLIEPATGRLLSSVPIAEEDEVAETIEAARAAGRSWRRLSGIERSKCLFAFAAVVEQHADELAVLDARATGMPIARARRVDVPAALSTLRYYAGWADKLCYAFPGATVSPVGTVAVRPSHRSGLLAAVVQVAPALAAGCVCIVQPPTAAALGTDLAASCWHEAELPDGVLSVLHGNDSTLHRLAGSRGIDLLSVEGEPMLGDEAATIERGHGGGVRRMLGIEAPIVVFADAPIDEAVDGVVEESMMGHCGLYGGATRLLVEERLHDAFVERLLDRLESLRCGDPLSADVEVGPMVDRSARRHVEQLIEGACDEGATVHRKPVEADLDSGAFVAPTILTDVHPSMAIARASIDGPVLPILTFRTPGEAAVRVNNTPWGHVATVWTEKAGKATAFARQMDVGSVWHNAVRRFRPETPVRAVKDSGRAVCGGVGAMRDFLELS